MRRRLHLLRQSGADAATLRIETLCGRLAHPTTYRLSRFVPTAAPVLGHGSAGEGKEA
ncbi:hypothetical protein [Streptomyces sp. SID5785]|uniref:hypothetical protein n=1 Tax=Streptomyces sp. SID5785 TaxID=2690309 RepID=UPI001F323460|nr:hypothetical protein [Streptomyces sp. SID5785]